MDVAATVIGICLAVVLVGSAIGKLTRAAPVVANLAKAGVPDSLYSPLAALEIAGAIGLVAGIWVMPLGVAAAVGVVLYFVGAVVFHVRAHDPAIVPPLVLAVVAAAAGVSRALA